MKKRVLASSVVLAFIFNQTASASVVLLQDNRSAQSAREFLGVGSSSDTTYSPQAPFSDWTISIKPPTPYAMSESLVLQSSYVSSDVMSGNGEGGQGYYVDKIYDMTYRYSSFFSIGFRVDTDQTLQLNATLKAFANQCCDGTALSLVGSQGTIVSALVQGVSSTAAGDVTDYSGSGLLNLSKTITLSPGEYTFSVGTSYPYVDGKSPTGGNWTFTANFSDDLTAVPLPSTIWLFVSAIGLTARRVIAKKLMAL